MGRPRQREIPVWSIGTHRLACVVREPRRAWRSREPMPRITQGLGARRERGVEIPRGPATQPQRTRDQSQAPIEIEQPVVVLVVAGSSADRHEHAAERIEHPAVDAARVADRGGHVGALGDAFVL